MVAICLQRNGRGAQRTKQPLRLSTRDSLNAGSGVSNEKLRALSFRFLDNLIVFDLVFSEVLDYTFATPPLSRSTNLSSETTMKKLLGLILALALSLASRPHAQSDPVPSPTSEMAASAGATVQYRESSYSSQNHG